MWTIVEIIGVWNERTEMNKDEKWRKNRMNILDPIEDLKCFSTND